MSLVVGTNRWRTHNPLLMQQIQQSLLMVDTAELYGRGTAERVIGRHLPGCAVSTKVMPWLWRRPSQLGHYLGRSLARLQRPSAELLYLHFPARHSQNAWLTAMAREQRAGRLRHIGLSNHTLPQLRSAAETLRQAGSRIHAVQAELSLLRPDILHSGLPAFCMANDIQMMAVMVFARGQLLQPAQAANSPVQRVLRDTAQRVGASPSQVILAWVAHHGFVPVVGTTSPEHLREALAYRALTLPESAIAQLDHVASAHAQGGLLRRARRRVIERSAKLGREPGVP